jgi:hypothetical protein
MFIIKNELKIITTQLIFCLNIETELLFQSNNITKIVIKNKMKLVIDKH